MANTKSAIKRIRQNERSRLRNRQTISKMRREIKKLRKLVEGNKVDDAREMLPRVYQVIDRTARKGVIHTNTAARYKSRLTRYLNRTAQ